MGGSAFQRLGKLAGSIMGVLYWVAGTVGTWLPVAVELAGIELSGVVLPFKSGFLRSNLRASRNWNPISEWRRETRSYCLVSESLTCHKLVSYHGLINSRPRVTGFHSIAPHSQPLLL